MTTKFWNLSPLGCNVTQPAFCAHRNPKDVQDNDGNWSDKESGLAENNPAVSHAKAATYIAAMHEAYGGVSALFLLPAYQL